MPNVTMALSLHLEVGYLGHPGSTFAAVMQAVHSALWHAGNVLPAMKHAAEELRCLGVSGAEGAGPSLRQAARSANEVLRAGDQTSQQISKLHADAMRVCIASYPLPTAPRPTFVCKIDRTFPGLCDD